jgi:hypothetical protein
MKRLLLIIFISALTACSTTAPVVIKFPEVPEALKVPAGKLSPLDTSKKIELSDIIENANENAGKYYELRERYNAWIEWYIEQKKIFDSIK